MAQTKVALTRKSTIRASTSSTSATAVPLSPFDLANAGFFPTYFHIYSPPPTPSSTDTIVSAIKSALAEALSHFASFAGRIDLPAAQILCNNEGIHFVEASAGFPLSALNFYSLDGVYEAVMVPIDSGIQTVQFTTYTCGGFSLAWTFDHGLYDAAGLNMFMSSFCEIAKAQQNGRLPVEPSVGYSHDRSALLLPKPVGSSSDTRPWKAFMEENYSVHATFDEVLSIMSQTGHGRANWKHVYYTIKGSQLEDLQLRASQGGCRRSKFEAVTAYIWKAMANTLKGREVDVCIMDWVVDGRRCWPGLTDGNKMFVGNLAVTGAREERVDFLTEKTLAEIASVTSASVRGFLNQDYFAETRDFIASNYPKVILPKAFLNPKVPMLRVNGVHSLPVMDVDFGFGRPRLVVELSPLLSSLFYLSFVSSGREDGSWLVAGGVWPELAAELESDPNQIFCPLSDDYVFGSCV